MATITITNLTTLPVYCSDLYCSVAGSGVVTTTRSPAQLEAMRSLQNLVTAGTFSLSVAYSADETGSGMVDQGLTASSANGLSDMQVIRIALTGATTGTADDVSVYAVGALPYAKMRVVDAVAYVSAGNSTGRTVQVRSAAAGTGTLCAEMPAAATGHNVQTATVTASQVITNGATVGLFIRRSDRAVAGEVLITVRPEV